MLSRSGVEVEPTELTPQTVYQEVDGGVTVCENPQQYVWWDEYHPTKKVSRRLGADIQSHSSPNPSPEVLGGGIGRHSTGEERYVMFESVY